MDRRSHQERRRGITNKQLLKTKSATINAVNNQHILLMWFLMIFSRFRFHLRAAFWYALDILAYVESQRERLASRALKSKLLKRVERNQSSSLLLSFSTYSPNIAPQSCVRNYSREELKKFLGVMLEIMPIGGDDWEAVLEEHSIGYPGR